MNKFKKNIVLVGFSEIEKRSIDIPNIGDIYCFKDMKEAKNHQGYLIIINNKDNINIVDIDKKYRKILNKYVKVWLYNEKYNSLYNKWCNIELINNDLFCIDSLSFWDQYELYKENIKNEIKSKYTKNKINNIEKIYKYIKNYKTIKTSQIVKELKISERMVQRYMKYINEEYNNIGYDYSNNEWYII